MQPDHPPNPAWCSALGAHLLHPPGPALCPCSAVQLHPAPTRPPTSQLGLQQPLAVSPASQSVLGPTADDLKPQLGWQVFCSKPPGLSRFH